MSHLCCHVCFTCYKYVHFIIFFNIFSWIVSIVLLFKCSWKLNMLFSDRFHMKTLPYSVATCPTTDKLSLMAITVMFKGFYCTQDFKVVYFKNKWGIKSVITSSIYLSSINVQKYSYQPVLLLQWWWELLLSPQVMASRSSVHTLQSLTLPKASIA